MNWLKSLAISLVKNQVMAHLDLLDALKPKMVKILVEKGKIDPKQADALSSDLLAIAKTEVSELVSKL